jgi:hypothetical protein
MEPILGEDTSGLADISEVTGARALLHVHRGHLSTAERDLDDVGSLADSPDAQGRSLYWAARAAVLHASGRFEEALAAGRRGMQDEVSTIPSLWIKESFAVAAAAAFELGDSTTVGELLAWVDALPPGRRPPALVAHASRLRGRLAARARDAETTDREYGRAIELFTSMAASFWAAAARVEWAELLAERGDAAAATPVAAQATATLRSLRATPWLHRVDVLAPSLEVAS